MNIFPIAARGTTVYVAQPDSLWKRAHNERHNDMLRDYIPKGESIERYTAEEILSLQTCAIVAQDVCSATTVLTTYSLDNVYAS